MRRLHPLIIGVLAALLLPLTAQAQVDPDPNGVGIYFDTGATQAAFDVAIPPGGHAEVVAYLVATRVSIPGFVEYVEGRVTWDQPQVSPLAGLHDWDPCWEMPVPMHDEICAWFNAGVLATGDAVVLRSYSVLLWDTDLPEPLRFFVPRMSLTLHTGQEIALFPSSGDPARPVAVINGPAPVPVASTGWGSLKVLFR